MARPRKQGIDLIYLDLNLLTHHWMKRMRMEFGNDAVTFYIVVLREIYHSPLIQIVLTDKRDQRILADEVGVTVEEFMKMVEVAVDLNVFDKKLYTDEQILTSEFFKKDADYILKNREESRKRYDTLAKK